MHNRALLTLLLLASPLAGCAPAPAGVAVAPVVAARPTVRVSGRLALGEVGRRRLVDVAPVAAWQASDITHFKIGLRREGGNELDLGELPGDATQIELADLRPNTAYILRLEAYADDKRIDTDDDSCETPFQTTGAPELTGVFFKVKLAPVELSIKTEGNLAITDGRLIGGT
jgi:hypothetical protein